MRGRRILFCFLFAVFLLPQWAGTACGESPDQPVNVSGSRNEALSVDPILDKEGFSAVLYDNRNGLPASEANAIAHTSDGFIWIGSYAGLFRYDGNDFERIDSETGIANVRCLYTDSRDRLWIGTNDSGLFLMSKGEIRNWNKDDGLETVSVRAVAECDGGVICAAGAGDGIALIDDELNLSVLRDNRLA